MALPLLLPIPSPSRDSDSRIHEQDESSTEMKRGVIAAVTAVALARDRVARVNLAGSAFVHANGSQPATETSKHFRHETA